uniref:Basic leucine zipper ATF-like transcription factor 2 n=1 Tax=Gasterosteus aculeatus aculeatus TaxID=481459 RepID=A0AAQ4S7S0_GASAC
MTLWTMGPLKNIIGRIRQENNKTAARKSRRKQTERADELHECMERANSAIKKEIAALKKDLHLYTTALERHKPFCCLRDSASNPTGPDGVLTSLQLQGNAIRRNLPNVTSWNEFPEVCGFNEFQTVWLSKSIFTNI